METILVFILTASYVLLFLYLTLGVLRAKRVQGLPAKPSVSIIVPLHNEEEFAARTLESLAAQQYDGEWEVICVNDRSTDKTPQILNEFCKANPRFKVLHVPMDLPTLPSPKKRALEFGFLKAQYDVLLTMDADCTPSTTWLSSMAGRFQGKIAVVQGAKQNTGPVTLLHSYQKLDTLGFTLIEAAGFSLGNPMVASAASLAYKKDLFYKVGGFSDLMQFTSGDDDMLVHKMIREDIEICYNLDPDAVIKTEPVNTWKALLNQRARWASNGTNYSNIGYIFYLTLIYCFYLWLIIGPIFVLMGFVQPSHWIGPMLAKIIIDALFLSIGGYRLKLLRFVAWLPLIEVVQIPLIAIAVPLGSFFKKFRWR